MDWLGPAVAIGLIVVVSGLVSAVQAYQGARRTQAVLREHKQGRWKAINDDVHDGHGYGPAHHHPAPDHDALHFKLDQLLERVPRSTFWRNTLWAITGYGLAKLADFGLYYFLGL